MERSEMVEGSVSELSYEDFVEALEVPLEDHLRTFSRQLESSPGRSTTISKRFSNLMHRRGSAQRGTLSLSKQKSTRPNPDVLSISSEHASQNSVGVHSAAQFTTSSIETVKVSNKKEKVDNETSKKGKRWSSAIRRMIGVKAEGEVLDSVDAIRQQRSYDEQDKGERRSNVFDSKPKRSRSTPSKGTDRQQMLDHTIRGRFDGIDVLALGGAQVVSHVTRLDATAISADSSLEKIQLQSFTGKERLESGYQIITEMLWTSAGRSPPEIVLEGYLPGGDDRWSVRIDTVRKDAPKNVSDQSTLIEPHDDDSASIPVHQIWGSLWGPGPAPANLVDVDRIVTDGHDDPLLHLAAECSIPIDIDEETFIVSTREHLKSVHDIVSFPLSKGDFELALKVLFKLLKGLNLVNDQETKLLRGSTFHNIGLIQLWQSDFQSAVTSFNQAVMMRSENLPDSHPDIAVSLTRKAMALLALEMFDEAAVAFDEALQMLPSQHLMRAKVLNNLGVVAYKQGDVVGSLRDFTKSLEIQRIWLEESIRRDVVVYDASVTMCNLGKLYLERSDYNLASRAYEEGLLLQSTIFQKDHTVVLSSSTCLALAKARELDFSKALQILQACLRSINSRLGPGSPQSIETVGCMGYLYALMNKGDDALKCLTAVRKWQKANLAVDNPSQSYTRDIVKAVEETVCRDVTVWI